MPKNLIRTTLTNTGTFTVPAGVTLIRLLIKPIKKRLCVSGNEHTCAIDINGQAYSWGLGTSGQLGDNTATSKSSPVAVTGNHRFISLASGDNYIIALKADGSAYAWGENTNGQLGDNTATSKSSPVAVVGGNIFIEVATGTGHSLARKIDGSVYAWGDNTNGQLGNNTAGAGTSTSSPVQVAGGHVFTQVASGGSGHSVALASDGSAWCWGLGTSGQLGNNTLNSSSSPVQVVGGLTFVEVGASGTHSFGLTSDGTMYAWGNNTNGGLGNNSTSNTSSPVQVAGGHKFTQIGAGSAQNGVARKIDGSIWAWGLGTNGRLGNNTLTTTSSPVQVAGTGIYSEIGSLGNFNAVARRADGSVWCWGNGGVGGIGNGSTNDQSSPVQVINQSFMPVNADFNFQALRRINLSVTPGTGYSYSTGASSYFGSLQLDAMTDQIIVEYFS